MLLVFNGPVNTETNGAQQWELSNQNASRLAGQGGNLQTGIVQEAGQAPRSGFKVIEEARQCRLTATLGRKQGQHIVSYGMALMTVCVVKHRVDILNQARW